MLTPSSKTPFIWQYKCASFDEIEVSDRLNLKRLKGVVVVFESALHLALEVPQQAADKTVPPVHLVQARQGVGNARFEAPKEECAKSLDPFCIGRLAIVVSQVRVRVRVHACAGCGSKFNQLLCTDKVSVKSIKERIDLYVTEFGQSRNSLRKYCNTYTVHILVNANKLGSHP
jgi:hypothetical protein